MNSRLTENSGPSKESRVSEYKSTNGVVFRAKFIGSIEVDELRGKTVAETAMAKLKMDIIKKRQHKTRINVHLKWDGFYVHLSEGGQEMLHCFLLDRISFVWKDPSDDRAIGLIITDGSQDKQSVAKFFAYKTEKSGIALIMALKELFVFRTSEESEDLNESAEVDNPEADNPEVDNPEVDNSVVDNPHVESENRHEDLMDLNFSLHKPDMFETFTSINLCKNVQTQWANFSENTSQTSIPSIISSVNPVSIIKNDQFSLSTCVKTSSCIPNPFEVSWPTSSCNNANSLNPFVQSFGSSVPNRTPNLIQKNNTIRQVPLETQIKNKLQTNFFSDLNPLNSNFNSSTTISSTNSNICENAVKKPSLADLRNSQLQKEPNIDFSVLDNDTSRTSILKPQVLSKTISTPLFQID